MAVNEQSLGVMALLLFSLAPSSTGDRKYFRGRYATARLEPPTPTLILIQKCLN